MVGDKLLMKYISVNIVNEKGSQRSEKPPLEIDSNTKVIYIVFSLLFGG